MFTIEFSNQSKKFLKKSDNLLAERIFQKIVLLKDDPVPHTAKKIVEEERTFRIRIGDYRVLYEIIYDKKIILIDKIDKRSRAY